MIAQFLHRHPQMLWLWALSILAVGAASILSLPRLEDPILRQRLGVVTTVLPGAKAVDVETSVTVPIEQELVGIAEIGRLRSTSRAESSNVVIELSDDVRDVAAVWARVRAALSDVAAKLPADADVQDLDVLPLKAFACLIAVKGRSPEGEVDLQEMSRFAEQLKAHILRLPGTERVDLFGQPDFEFLVNVEPRQIAATYATTGQIAQAIAEHHQRYPQSTQYADGTKELLGVETTGPFLDRLRQTPIRIPVDQRAVSLDALAKVEETEQRPTKKKAVIDGQQAIVLGVLVQDSVRLDLWDNDLQALLARVGTNEVFRASRIFSQRTHIDQRLDALLLNLALSTLLVVAVTCFMMGWRASLVVATSLPLAAAMVLAGLWVMEIPLHQMSVTGLIVSLGLLIDNAIVMVEDIRGRAYDGLSIREAMQRAIVHLRFPLFASTLTTALAFLPLGTMGGPAGEFVGSLAVSVILAIASSLVLSLTLIPAMFGYMQGDAPAQLGGGVRLAAAEQSAARALRTLYRWPLLCVLLSCVLPAIGFYMATTLRKQFFPPSDRAQIQIEVETTASSALSSVERATQAVAEIIAADSRVTHQSWFYGASAPSFYYNVVPRRRNSEFYAQAFLDVADGQDCASVVRALQTACDENILDSRVLVRLLAQGPPFDAPVEVRIVGTELEVLQELGAEVRAVLSRCGGVTHTRADMEESILESNFLVAENVATSHGLSRDDIARFLFAHTTGVTVDNIFDQGREVSVRVKADLAGDTAKLLALPVPGGAPAVPGAAAGPEDPPPIVPPLGSLGEFVSSARRACIIRVDGERVNEVKAYLQAGVLPAEVLDTLRTRLAENPLTLPVGYRLEYGGESEKRQDAVDRLIANATVLFLLMLLTLVAAFRSLKAALIIAGVGGLTIGLGPLTLYLFEFPFGFMAIVGTMGLVGIAINDSIVVLAAIYEVPDAAQQSPDELSQVVLRCARHILTTTLTTLIGFLPLVLFGGDFWAPLAITISAGVAGATLMAFCFTPAMHLLLGSRRSDT